jgi:hypothetical protein
MSSGGAVGYQHLIDSLGLRVLPLVRQARVAPVLRVQPLDGVLQIPAGVAPQSDRPLEHLLFALKHEGTELAVISAAFDHIRPQDLLEELAARPTGGFIRKACYLWEALRGQELTPARAEGSIVELFDPTKYLVAERGVRDLKWRVDFNGLGNWDMCPVVRRSEAIEAMLDDDVLGQAAEVLRAIKPEMLERAMAWAYLNETRNSFAIEREMPAHTREQAYVRLLQQVWSPRRMDEDYLVELQNATITNPHDRAVQYRIEQNHLSDSGRGAVGVTYVPPAPAQVERLMAGVLAIANGDGAPMPPLIRASLASFGFVYVHPFMDGNGRLSRFLSHYVLANSGVLPDSTILPLSVALKREELGYLRALQAFSRPARALWDVTWLEGSRFEFALRGHPDIYRFWDATAQTEFMGPMGQQALQRDIVSEVDYLESFDRAYRRLNRDFDVRNPVLTSLIRMCVDNDGALSKNRRKQFALEVQPELFDAIERVVREEFTRLAPPASAPNKPPRG